MKKLLLLPLFILSLMAKGQYDPSKATVTNKPLGVAQAVPTDARSYYYSTTLFIWRPYQSIAEVLATLNLAKYRAGNFPIYVSSGALQSNGSFVGGTIKEYWFKDGVLDADLVEKASGGGETTSGTVAQLRALSTTTGRSYTLTGVGGGPFTDIGLSDGAIADDGNLYIITYNNHILKRQITGPVHAKWFTNPADTLDDLAGLNAAVAATPSGGTLIIDAGNFYLSNSLTINKPIVLQGEGNAFQSVSQITPKFNFPSNNPLIHFTNAIGRFSVYDICSFMSRRGGDWIQIEGDVSDVHIERNAVRHVSANHWGLNFHNPSGVNGIALNVVRSNGFYDFDGGGIFVAGGGDSNWFLDNWMQLVNSSSHIILYNGVVGSAKFNFSGNNVTGAAKMIEMNGLLEPTIANNQIEATVNVTNAQKALVMLGNTIIANDVFGPTIENNNLNCSSGSGHANVAIYLGDVQDAHLNNNTIFGSDTALKVGSLGRRIVFNKGFTEGVVYDPLGEVTIRSAGSTNVFQSDIQMTGKNSSGIRFGVTNTISNLNIDAVDNITSNDVAVRFFRSTNTTGTKSVDILKGDGTGSFQHHFDAYGNSYMQALNGGLMVGSNATPDPNASLQLSGNLKGFLTTRMYRAQAEAIPLTNGLLTYDLTTNNLLWNNGAGIKVIEDSTVLAHKGLEETFVAKKTFQGNTPLVISSSSTSGGNMQFTNAANPAGFYSGITGDVTGDYLVYNGTTGQVSMKVNKTNDRVYHYGAVSTATRATQPEDLLRKDQLDSAYTASAFILRNAGGTGDTMMKVVSGSEVAMKRISITNASKVVTDTTITYTINGTGVNGTFSFTGNSSTTSFTIPLSIVGLTTTSKVFLDPNGTIGASVDWIDKSTESITIHYLTAPTTGVKSINYFIIP